MWHTLDRVYKMIALTFDIPIMRKIWSPEGLGNFPVIIPFDMARNGYHQP